MPNLNERFLNCLSHNFSNNRLDAVADHFVYPMPCYAQDQLQVFGAACTLSEALTVYRDATVAARITRILPRIVAEGLPVNGYSNVWVEWDHLDQRGVCVRVSQVRYVLYHDGAALFPKIEMVEYKVTAFPEVHAGFAMVVNG